VGKKKQGEIHRLKSHCMKVKVFFTAHKIKKISSPEHPGQLLVPERQSHFLIVFGTV